MTKPIEGVSERILSCAKEGFLEKRICGCIASHNCGKSRDNHGFYLFPVPGQGRTVWRSGGTGSRRQNAENFKRIRLRIFFEWK